MKDFDLLSPGRVQSFIAPWPVELVADMPAPSYDAAHPRAFTRLAHVLVPDCREGDLLDCSATLQISNRLGEIVEFCAALVLTPAASGPAGIVDLPGALFNTSSAQQPGNGRFITRFPGFNVTPNWTAVKFPYGGMHHAPFARHGRIVVPADCEGDNYVAYIAYAAGTTFDASRTVSVDAWCGDLSVIRHR